MLHSYTAKASAFTNSAAFSGAIALTLASLWAVKTMLVGI